MKIPEKWYVDELKKEYPAGTRVELAWMDDIHAPPIGTQGTVVSVDDIGTIHVNWDNGSSLGVALWVDKVFKVINS